MVSVSSYFEKCLIWILLKNQARFELDSPNSRYVQLFKRNNQSTQSIGEFYIKIIQVYPKIT